ncbi:DNA-protecting protein DprA [Pigmentiphaga aceris]|uniref:DNA-protecting protein DprA n=1 Tax=Pigmentiphaga aceris TaxID=1940612 RepID=A0A5C0AUF7_9BURK|nr:DNA-processing protein DprA [Pigmentiphaga aceris]QEI04540.1 DNA-protecting protein DprA [Pigmentiphaga aceris]
MGSTTSPALPSLAAWLRLADEPDVGPVLAGKLMQAFGPPEQLYATPQQVLAQHLPFELARRIAEPPTQAMLAYIERALAWQADHNHHVLTLADAHYPDMLREMSDPPVLLYVVGDVHALSRRTIAIVGARHATPGGNILAHDFAQALATRDWCIASGLALGIDAAAHRGTLAAAGKTVAVVGTGADIVYPARNRDLAHQIAASGAIVSELPLGTKALPHHFPRRNRLVAGLSRGVLVVEAAVHSGSLITARLAADMGREVFAIPGSIHSPLSRGCHALIRQGAKLVETAQDVLDELSSVWPDEIAEKHHQMALIDDDANEDSAAKPPHTAAKPGLARATTERSIDQDEKSDHRQNNTPTRRPDSKPDEDPLLDQLGFDPLNIDEVQLRSGLPADTLQVRLLTLELSGRIARLPGARVQRLR